MYYVLVACASGSQPVVVDLTYDSSRKMVSSTWFSAESNLEGERTISEDGKQINLHKKVILVLFCAPTCWYEVLRPPAVAFQEQWSSPRPLSAAQARPRWPAEMPEWPRFAGISPVDACRSSRKTISHWSVTKRTSQTTFKVDHVRVWSWLPRPKRQHGDSLTHLLSLVSNRRRSMRLATVCTEKNVQRWRRDITKGNPRTKYKIHAIGTPLLVRALKVTVCELFYLVAVLKQHPSSWELVDGVKIEGTRGSVVWSLWDFLKKKKYYSCSERR